MGKALVADSAIHLVTGAYCSFERLTSEPLFSGLFCRGLDHLDATRADALNLDDRAVRSSPCEVGGIGRQVVERSRRKKLPFGFVGDRTMPNAK
jgi:hypothetical protein